MEHVKTADEPALFRAPTAVESDLIAQLMRVCDDAQPHEAAVALLGAFAATVTLTAADREAMEDALQTTVRSLPTVMRRQWDDRREAIA